MARCPKCGNVIDTLIAVVNERNTYRFSESRSYNDADRIEFEADIFKCPECLEELPLADEDAATELLLSDSDAHHMFEFTIHVIGEGQTEKEAWDDAGNTMRENEWSHIPEDKNIRILECDVAH